MKHLSIYVYILAALISFISAGFICGLPKRQAGLWLI